MTRLLCALLVLTGASVGLAGEAQFSAKPTVAKAGDKTAIQFTVAAATDVEVAILDAQGKVVRHLAAGVLGAKEAPPAPLKAGLAQSLEWDGKDDYGQPVAGASVRVRIGMGVKPDKIAGGDPYAFYSKEMGQGDHSAWAITGLEAKSDGNVYVMGLISNYGPVAIRRYDALGNYQRTVYPPPAGKAVEDVKGWGVAVREDGSYAPKYGQLEAISPSTTLIFWGRAHLAGILPTPENDKLTLCNDSQQTMTIGTDGTLRDYRPVAALPEPPAPKGGLTGPFFSANSQDGKTMYASGLFACDDHWKGSAVQTTGFWRDGQVWRVDVATRKAEPFFALPEKDVIGEIKARGASPIADDRYSPHAALAGVAVDAAGNVFVCDRQNRRIVVLDKGGKLVREIPNVMHPDAIAVNPKSRALYVTTRWGNYASRGAEATLLKFNDWTKDDKPVQVIKQCPINWYGHEKTFLAVYEKDGEVLVWFAYTTVPVRIYRDKGAELELVKDFYEAGPQRALDLQHFVVDPQTENVYTPDGFNNCFRIADWRNPAFTRCMVDAKTPLLAISMAVDARGRFLYCHQDRRPVTRFKLDGEFLAPAPVGGANAFTPQISNDWRIRLGLGDRGIAAAPDGSVVTMNALGSSADYGGYLRFYRADPAKAPWGEGLLFKSFGEKVRAAGARFDPRGNLYAGKFEGRLKNAPKGFENDGSFAGSTGRIYKFAATGPLGDLFPKEPAAPAKVYDVHYGAIGPNFTRTPWFGVDGWGRIWYPSSLQSRVAAIDNEGNEILAFGTYGNRDSMGGLAGDLVPTKDVPMAYPNCVDATDDYVYVSDIVNTRLMRLAKTFAAAETVGIK
ncbi:MAG TPA: hypothetical protein PK280_06880 [Planctomycetota bacterium]|nr:hypothetical protein [Planctomycetota bacterium]